MKHIYQILDALLLFPDLNDIPVDEVVEEVGNYLNSRHKDVWKNVLRHNFKVVQFDNADNIAHRNGAATFEFMRMVRSMILLNPQNAGRKERFGYSGPDDEVTRDFCATRVGNAYTMNQILSWNNYEWAGKIPGSDYDILINLGGYNCRHVLIPVNEK